MVSRAEPGCVAQYVDWEKISVWFIRGTTADYSPQCWIWQDSEALILSEYNVMTSDAQSQTPKPPQWTAPHSSSSTHSQSKDISLCTLPHILSSLTDFVVSFLNVCRNRNDGKTVRRWDILCNYWQTDAGTICSSNTTILGLISRKSLYWVYFAKQYILHAFIHSMWLTLDVVCTYSQVSGVQVHLLLQFWQQLIVEAFQLQKKVSIFYLFKNLKAKICVNHTLGSKWSMMSRHTI